MSSEIGEAESLRQRDGCARGQREARAKAWANFCDDLAVGWRKVARIFFWSVVLTVAICYRSQILDFVGPKAGALLARMKQVGDTSSLRQTAVEHENEVAAAAK